MFIDLTDKELDKICGGVQVGQSIFAALDSNPNTTCALTTNSPNAGLTTGYVFSGNPAGQLIAGGAFTAIEKRGIS